jgi:hypothetical protein
MLTYADVRRRAEQMHATALFHTVVLYDVLRVTSTLFEKLPKPKGIFAHATYRDGSGVTRRAPPPPLYIAIYLHTHTHTHTHTHAHTLVAEGVIH